VKSRSCARRAENGFPRDSRSRGTSRRTRPSGRSRAANAALRSPTKERWTTTTYARTCVHERVKREIG